MVLVECIDNGLGVLGKDDQRKIYWRMLLQEKMKENGTSNKGILRDPEGFQKTISDTFGIGAWAIERAISREIKAKFKLETIETGSFVLIIRTAMQIIRKSKEEN